MMKEGVVSHSGNEFHPYANGNMQHMYKWVRGRDSEESMWMTFPLDLPSYLFSNSRQTPDSGLGNEELRNSMNNASGDNSGSSAGGGAPPGFVSDLPF